MTKKAAVIKPKPCPFCGSLEIGIDYVDMWPAIACADCGVRCVFLKGDRVYSTGRDFIPHLAVDVKRWNKRAKT